MSKGMRKIIVADLKKSQESLNEAILNNDEKKIYLYTGYNQAYQDILKKYDEIILKVMED